MGKENYFARIFEPAINKIPDNDKALVNALMRPLEPATAFFRAQIEEGFYGNLNPNDKLPEAGDSPYTIIRSNDGHKVYRYGEIDPYKGYLRDMARKIDDAIGVAFDTHDPEKDLIEAVLRPRALALKEGKLAEAMILGLNTRLTPRYHLFIGLLDRYLDPRGLKVVMQAWAQSINSEKNQYFNELARQITGHPIQGFRIIYGDMLAAGGMTVDKPWSGNTVPSEDDLRNHVGADIYLFPNNMDVSTKEEDITAVKTYLPQVVQLPGSWEEVMFQAKKIGITAHEIGHALIPFDGETVNLLDGKYMAIKELLAELFAVKEIAKLSRNLINSSMKQLIFARSLSRWRYYVDQYDQESNLDRKAILSHYAWAGVWRTNYQERGGGVKVREDGAMEVSDWDKFVELDKNLYHELLNAISNEKHQVGFVEGVINLNSRLPRTYIGKGNGYYPPSPQAAAA